MVPNDPTGHQPRPPDARRHVTIRADLTDAVAVIGWAGAIAIAVSDSLAATAALTAWACLVSLAAAVATNVAVMGRRVERVAERTTETLVTDIMRIGIELGRGTQATPHLAAVSELRADT